MRFESIEQCRKAVQRVAILSGRNLNILRSIKKLLEVICVEGCPFRLYASVIHREQVVCIKTLVDEHICTREMRNRQATAAWLAEEYMSMFETNPNWTPQQLKDDAFKTYVVDVHMQKCCRAKHMALTKLRGIVGEHYAQLRPYCAELPRVDPEGRFEFLLDAHGQSEGFFIGFSALKHGFLARCRPLLGLDGCFLKTFLGGTLLTTVAKDGNNQMYPIFWDVAAIENEEYWTWFIRILLEELNISDGMGFTFISDQQKGLGNAIANLAPLAEHRNCARHVYCNWKKEFKGETLKRCFWQAVNCTNPETHKNALVEMRTENEAAYKDFIERETYRFCKAHISDMPKSDMIDNNIAETFNAYILKSRTKHIIDMLEEIRVSIMEKMHEKHEEMKNMTGRICPRIVQMLEVTRYYSRNCICKPAVGGRYQIMIGDEGYVVDLEGHTCTCKGWQITGLPCTHTCTTIHFMHQAPADYAHRFVEVHI
ncbi:hypothetical protein ACS0TY_005578 [Phlomoides rotata]